MVALLYGPETWKMTYKDENDLEVFKINKKIYGSRWQGCQRKWNPEVYEFYNYKNIIKGIQIKSLRWLGHIMDEDDPEICQLATVLYLRILCKANAVLIHLLDHISRHYRVNNESMSAPNNMEGKNSKGPFCS